MKKFLSILITVTMTVTMMGVVSLADGGENVLVTAPAPEIVFSDVNADTPGAEAIYKLAKAGIIEGHGDGTFAPDGFLKRAELAKMINLVFGYSEPAEENFWDVKPEDWFYNHVLIAKKAEYIIGYEDGRFAGNDNLTREQVCAVINRCAGIMLLEGEIKVEDAISEWAVMDVMKILSNKLMPLEENNTFRATEKITRAELAQVLAYFVIDVPVPETTPTPTPTATPTAKPTGGGNGGGGGVTRPETTPTAKPTTAPSTAPTTAPTTAPSTTPTTAPTTEPTTEPSAEPTTTPTTAPSAKPTTEPTAEPTTEPTPEPTAEPTPSFDNSEVVKHLTITVEATSKLRFTASERAVMTPVLAGINGALADADDVELTKEYVKSAYSAEIKQAKRAYKAMSEDAQTEFYTKLANALELETINFLNEYFLSDEEVEI